MTTLLLVSFVHFISSDGIVVMMMMFLCVFSCCYCFCCCCLFYTLLKHHWIRLNSHHSLIFQEMIINLFESWPAGLFDIIRTYRLYIEYTLYVWVCVYLCVSFVMSCLVPLPPKCMYILYTLYCFQYLYHSWKFSKYCSIYYFTPIIICPIWDISSYKFYRTHLSI